MSTPDIYATEEVRREIANYKARRRKDFIDYSLCTLLFIIAILWHFNKINIITFTSVGGFVLVLWAMLRVTIGVTKTNSDSEGHNQGVVMLWFFVGLSIFMAFTVTLTVVIVSEILNFENFVMRTIINTTGVVVNTILLINWINNSFLFDVSGKKIVQLKLNGKLLKHGSNLRPSKWLGVCKMFPFSKGWMRVESRTFDEETKTKSQVTTKGEDGQQFNLKSSDSETGKTDIPRIVKYRLDYMIGDTYICSEIEEPEDRIKDILFKQIETVLNSAENTAVSYLNSQKNELARKILPSLMESFQEIGLKVILFNLNSIEKTKAEEDAEIKGRVIVTTARKTAEADIVENEGILASAEAIYTFTGDNPAKMAAVQAALVAANESEGLNVSSGGGPPIRNVQSSSRRDNKKGRQQSPNSRIGPIITDLDGADDNDGGE